MCVRDKRGKGKKEKRGRKKGKKAYRDNKGGMQRWAPWDRETIEAREKAHNLAITRRIVAHMRALSDQKRAEAPGAKILASLQEGEIYVPAIFGFACKESTRGEVSVFVDPLDGLFWRLAPSANLCEWRAATNDAGEDHAHEEPAPTLYLDRRCWCPDVEQRWNDDQLAEALVHRAYANDTDGWHRAYTRAHNVVSMRRGERSDGRDCTPSMFIVKTHRWLGSVCLLNDREHSRMWAYDLACRVLDGTAPLSSVRTMSGAACLMAGAEARLACERIKYYAYIARHCGRAHESALDEYGKRMRLLGAAEAYGTAATALENDPVFHTSEIAPCQAAFVASLSDHLVDL